MLCAPDEFDNAPSTIDAYMKVQSARRQKKVLDSFQICKEFIQTGRCSKVPLRYFRILLSIFLSIHKLIVRLITQRVWINVLIDILVVRNRLCANIGFVDYVRRMMTVSSFTCTIWPNCHLVISLVHSGNAIIRNVYSFIYGLKNKQESVRGTHEDFAKRDPNVLINTFGE